MPDGTFILLLAAVSLPGPGLQILASVPPAAVLTASAAISATTRVSVAPAAPAPTPAASATPTPAASATPAPAATATSLPPASPVSKPTVIPTRPSASVAPGNAAPSGRPSLSPSADGEPDRAEHLVGGIWQCETIAGSTGTHTYTANEDDGSIELQTALHAGFRTFDITEVYRFDDAHNVWTVETTGGAYAGTAPRWTGDKWIFDGTAKLNGQRRPVRMVYFDLGQQAFRRDFQARQDGVWRTYSAETCKRPSV